MACGQPRVPRCYYSRPPSRFGSGRCQRHGTFFSDRLQLFSVQSSSPLNPNPCSFSSSLRQAHYLCRTHYLYKLISVRPGSSIKPSFSIELGFSVESTLSVESVLSSNQVTLSNLASLCVELSFCVKLGCCILSLCGES